MAKRPDIRERIEVFRALIHLVDLLHDPEPHARSGAARAIACTQPLAAEAVLRSKALGGDPEAEVTGDCLAALLRVAGNDALDFVAGFLDGPDADLRGLAAIALGESHLDGALPLLRARWDAEPLKREAERVLLRAAALHRSEPEPESAHGTSGPLGSRPEPG